MTGYTCSVSECPDRRHARGYCAMHYWRAKRGINLHMPLLRSRDNVPSYSTLHGRLRRLRGTPEVCAHCAAMDGRPCQWALDWPRVPASDLLYHQVVRRGRIDRLPYSVNLSDYIGLCLPCHRAFDRDPARSVAA